MDGNSLKVLMTLIKNSERIKFKDDEQIYNIFFKDKYDYDTYQDIIYSLHDENLLYGVKADCKLYDIEINEIKTNSFLMEKRKDFINTRVMPIITSLIMPIIVSIVVTIITTYFIKK